MEISKQAVVFYTKCNKRISMWGICMDKILKERQIDWLLHFTRAENLPNIMRYGLMPRSNLEFAGIDFSYNDEYRYDNCENAVCTSIEFPNYKMFYPLRRYNPDLDWAVLLLDARIICDFECAFCSTNAGSSNIYNMDLEQRKGKRAFLKLFEELPYGPSRKELGIEDWYPTNPQAEVLVFDTIPITYIEKVFFDEQEILEQYADYIPQEILAEINSKAFKYRDDWEYWR